MKDQLPAISIGIPFFNAESDLLNAVRSVFYQTHQDWELILLDDGSTDNSLTIAKSIDDARVRVISDGQNKHLSARLNQIARLAKYEFVARMDADDLMAPDRIERQLKILLSNPHLDLISTGVYSLQNDNTPVGARCVQPTHQITSKALLSGSCGIVNAACVGRREWFLRNTFDESLQRGQDANLWIRAFSKNDLNALVLREPLYFYREDNNVSEKNILASYKVLRYSILNDAKQHYPLSDRVGAYLNSLLKSVAIWVLARANGLDAIRKRRVATQLTEAERQEVSRIIDHIRSIELPRTDSEG